MASVMEMRLVMMLVLMMIAVGLINWVFFFSGGGEGLGVVGRGADVYV